MSFITVHRADARLVKNVLAGRRDDFGVLVDRYFPAIEAIAYAHTGNHADAADIAQEAFICAYQKLDTLREGEKFRAWTGSIARHLAHRFREKRRHEVPLVDPPEKAAESLKPEEREMQELVRRMIGELDEFPREVLALHYFAGKSLREIADIQGISREAAAKRLQRAREVLGEKLLARLQPPPAEKAAPPISRKKAILAAIAATPAAWEAAAAGTVAAGSTGLGLSAVLSGKGAAVLLGVAVAATAAVTLWQQVPASPATETPMDAPAAASSTSLAANAPMNPTENTLFEKETAAVAPSPETISQEKGPGRLIVRVLDMQGNPVPNAEGYAERINWKPEEMPPAETVKRFGKADATGAMEYSDLPLGEYGVVAFAPGGVDVNEEELTERNLSDEVALNLKPSFPLGGRLLDEAGKPVEGAVLYPHRHILAPDQELPSVSTAAARQTTGPDGKFRFPTLWPGSYAFYVQRKEAPGFVTEYLPANTEDSVVRLPQTVDVQGRIFRADTGEAVPGVHLYLSPDETLRARVKTVSGEDGAFLIEQVPFGTYEARLDDAVMICASNDLKVMLAGGHAQTLDIPVREGGSIVGHVTDAVTGSPITGVAVHVNNQRQDIWRTSEKSDALGMFSLLGLPDGMYEILPARREGYYAASDTPKELTVKAGKEYTMDVLLMPGVPVVGIVTDAAGNPVAGAEVHVRSEGDRPGYYGDTKTDDRGRFHMAEGPAVPQLYLWAEKADRYSHVLGPQALPEVGLDGLVLTLDLVADAQVEGQVKSTALAQGGLAQFMTWYHVSLEPKDASIPKMKRVKAQAMGAFRISKVIPGSYTLRLEKGPYYEQCTGGDITVASGESKTGVQVGCGKEAGALTISGRVVDSAGKPVVGAEVFIQPASDGSIRTGLQGEFTLSGLIDAEYDVCARSPKHSDASAHVSAGDADVEIVMAGLGSVSGRVVDANTGKAITDFSVKTTSGDVSQYMFSPWTGTKEKRIHDADGRFVLSELPMGKNSIRVYAEGYAIYTGLLPDLTEGVSPPESSIALDPGAVVQGVVLDAAHHPVPGTKVFVGEYTYNGEWAQADAVSGGDGRFQIEGAPQDGIMLYTYHKGFAPSCVNATPGNECVIALTQGGAIRGAISLQGRSDDTYAQVTVSQEQWPAKARLGDSDILDIREKPAAYMIENLPPGEATLTIVLLRQEKNQRTSYRHIATVTRTALVTPGKTSEVNLVFGPASGAIEGRVTFNRAVPKHASVFLTLEGEQGETVHKMACVNAEGAFRLDDLPAGTGTLDAEVMEDNGVRRVRTEYISIREGQTLAVDFDYSAMGSTALNVQLEGLPSGAIAYVTVYSGTFQPEEEALLSTDRQGFIGRMEGRRILALPGLASRAFRTDGLTPGDYTAVMFAEAPSQGDAGVDEEIKTDIAAQAFHVEEGQEAAVVLRAP